MNTLHFFAFFYRNLLIRLKRDLFSHDAFDLQGFLQHENRHPKSNFAGDTNVPVNTLFLNNKRILESTNTGLSNVGSTTLKIFSAILGIAGLVVWATWGQEIHIANPPDIQLPLDYLTMTILNSVNTVEHGLTTIRESFSGSKHLMAPDQNSMICPESETTLGAIVSCFFASSDLMIYNIMGAIPSYSRYIGSALADFLRAIAPPHFHIDDLINNARLFIQRFFPLQDPSTEIHAISSMNTNGTSADATKSNTLNKASFTFPPFPEDVIEVKSLCENRCAIYSTNASNFIFNDIEVQGSQSTIPMTKRDYYFDVLDSDIIYICQVKRESNFGGTWIVIDQTCLCSDSCSTSDFFGFTGCADLLNRVEIPCSSEKPCTIDRVCPFKNHLIQININDQRDALYDGMNELCLDVCSELSGYGSFAALLAISATLGAVPTNAFGLINNPFGSSLGVPVSLLPGTPHLTLILIIKRCLLYNKNALTKYAIKCNEQFYFINI